MFFYQMALLDTVMDRFSAITIILLNQTLAIKYFTQEIPQQGNYAVISFC